MSIEYNFSTKLSTGLEISFSTSLIFVWQEQRDAGHLQILSDIDAKLKQWPKKYGQKALQIKQIRKHQPP